MIASAALLAVVLCALSLYSLLLLAVFSGKAYRNGYAAGVRQRPVVVAPDEDRRGWVA